MNSEKVIFGFFITLAAALNFGFWLGEMDRVELHNVWVLAAAIVVSLIATVLKFGDRTQLGAVAPGHLTGRRRPTHRGRRGLDVGGDHPRPVSPRVDMATDRRRCPAGALLANVISVVLMVSELITARR